MSRPGSAALGALQSLVSVGHHQACTWGPGPGRLGREFCCNSSEVTVLSMLAVSAMQYRHCLRADPVGAGKRRSHRCQLTAWRQHRNTVISHH